MKVLVADKIASEAVKRLSVVAGIEVDNAPGLSPADLKAIRDKARAGDAFTDAYLPPAAERMF